MSLPYIIQGNNIIIVINGKPHTINKDTHPRYQKVVDAIRDNDWEAVEEFIDVNSALNKYVNGALEIANGEIRWNGRHFHNALSKRLMKMFEDGFPMDPMVNFMENLMKNPSYRAVEELYGFLEQNELPITPDGHFLAYKRVAVAPEDNSELGLKKGDFVDGFTRKIKNNVGCKPHMGRNTVDDNKDKTCSYGLHFASMSFVSCYGGPSNPIVVLKVNPEDVVSIPTDYNNQKGRCSDYEVVDIYKDVDKTEPETECVENEDVPVSVTFTDAVKHVKDAICRCDYNRFRSRATKSHKHSVNGSVYYFQQATLTQIPYSTINSELASLGFNCKLVPDGDSLYIVRA